MRHWLYSHAAVWRVDGENDPPVADMSGLAVTVQQDAVEILGFWTPEYLQARVQTLKEFTHQPILLLAQGDKKEYLESLGLPHTQAVM